MNAKKYNQKKEFFMLANENFGNINKNLSTNFDITYRKIKEDVYLYRLVIMFVDADFSLQYNTYFRLCHLNELTKIVKHPINFFKLEKNDLTGYKFFKPEIKEALRQDSSNGDNENYVVPFQDILFAEDTFINSLTIAQMNHYYGFFKEYGNDIPFAKSMPFDYINGSLDNAHYDLNEVMKILSKRKDITFEPKRGTDVIIQEIPYYNADKYRNHFIAFTWHPTDEDWKTYVNSSSFGNLDRYEYILKNIFKLQKKA